MAPAIKKEDNTSPTVDQEEQMDIDETSEVEEHEDDEENSDEEMDEEPDLVVSADKIEIVRVETLRNNVTYQ
jgi:DNA-directed RNA polymerase I and III subunit RPAC2